MIIITPKNISLLKSNDLITLKCECCQDHFKRKKKYVQSVLNGSKKTKLKYCSTVCQFQMQRKRLAVKCKRCDKQFSKLPSQIKKVKNNFCSRSCAVSWNNKHSNRTHGPKKTKFYYCKICNVLVKDRNRYCKDHKVSIISKTIAESEDLSGRPANKYRSVRDHARNTAIKAGILKSCKICGYSKHVVTCHIKEISSFEKSTLIGKINNLSNLVGLCKNHHWEMDHNLLSENDKIKLNT